MDHPLSKRHIILASLLLASVSMSVTFPVWAMDPPEPPKATPKKATIPTSQSVHPLHVALKDFEEGHDQESFNNFKKLYDNGAGVPIEFLRDLSRRLAVDCPISDEAFTYIPPDIKSLSLAFFEPSLAYREYLKNRSVSKKKQYLTKLAKSFSKGNWHAHLLIRKLSENDKKVFPFLKAYGPLQQYFNTMPKDIGDLFAKCQQPFLESCSNKPLFFWELLDPDNVCRMYYRDGEKSKLNKSRKTFARCYEQNPEQIATIAFQMATNPKLFPDEPFWAHLAVENGCNESCAVLRETYCSEFFNPSSGTSPEIQEKFGRLACHYLFKLKSEKENNQIENNLKKMVFIKDYKNKGDFDTAKFYGKIWADEGDKGSQYLHGSTLYESYEHSRKIEDLNEALKYYELAAAQGFLEAHKKCAEIYSLPSKENQKKAQEHFQAMAVLGDPTAMAFIQAHSTGQLPDCVKTILDQKLARQDPTAQSQQAGLREPQDLKMIFDQCKLSADQGSTTAQEACAQMLQNGQGTPENPEKAFGYYKLAADDGKSPSAEHKVSMAYDKGEGVPKDPEMAFHYCKLSAEKGYAPAQYNYGLAYEKGEGVSKDPKMAFHYYKLSADQGCALAQGALGFAYEHGEGIPQDLNMALHYYKLSADQGDALSQYNWGIMLSDGKAVPRDLKMAFDYCELSANQGYAPAQNALGLAYDKGEVVPQDLKMAFDYFKLSADQGYALSQYNCGIMLSDGKGVPKDLNKAFEYYELSANQGYAPAQHNCGFAYKNGEGVPKDLNMAFRYWKLSAEQGYAKAQYSLGFAYENGEGVPKDLNMALHYYKLSADQGNLWAKNNYALLLLEIEGKIKYKEVFNNFKYAADKGHVPAQYNYARLCHTKGRDKNLGKVITYYTRAAEAGHAMAQCSLGQIFLSEEGVPHNLQEALKWYKLAADQGLPEAQYLYGFHNKREGVPEDLEERFRYFKLAADQGFELAQLGCAQMLINGQGVSKDYEEGLKYLKLSANQGNTLANIIIYMLNNITRTETDQEDKVIISFSNNDRDSFGDEENTTPQKELKEYQIENEKLYADSLAKKKAQKDAALKTSHTLTLNKKRCSEISANFNKTVEMQDKTEKTTVKHWETLELVKTIFGQGARKINTFSNKEAQQAFADLGCMVNETPTAENSTFLSYDLGERGVMNFKYHNPHGHGDNNLYADLKPFMKRFLISINKTPETVHLKERN